jgi:hypothetical protein
MQFPEPFVGISDVVEAFFEILIRERKGLEGERS